MELLEKYAASRDALRASKRHPYLFWKRVIDVVVSFVLLMSLALPMLIVAFMIRLESEGPAIFRQTRLGRNLVPFTVLKFRTMKSDAPHDCPSAILVGADREAALTRLGRFLRRSSFDELPQLWNVLVGEMSLVGPRPLIPREAGLHRLRARLGATAVRPGITGLAQTAGRDERSDLEKACLDGIYASGVSAMMDATVLLRTVRTVIGGRGSD